MKLKIAFNICPRIWHGSVCTFQIWFFPFFRDFYRAWKAGQIGLFVQHEIVLNKSHGARVRFLTD